ncbi:MAG: hypothetical protein ACOCTT_01955 [archaeon]
MKFRNLYRLVAGIVVTVVTADLIATWWGLRTNPLVKELNPTFNLIRSWFSIGQILAIFLVFFMILSVVVIGYFLAKQFFDKEPYNGEVSEVALYLTDLKIPKFSDIYIFLVLAIYSLLIFLSLDGFLRWINIFIL